jgi:hypothetical protein
VAAGYTTMNPSDLNAILKPGTEVAEIKSGMYVSLDAGIPLLPTLKLSPRVVAVFADQGKANFGGTKATADANIVPMELGLALDLGVPLSDLSGRVGVWGGYGLATVATLSENGAVKTTSLYQGGAFTAEVLGAIRYKILPLISLSLEAGYRMANVAQLKDGAGKEMKNTLTNKDVAFDFSGANIGGGLTFSF